MRASFILPMVLLLTAVRSNAQTNDRMTMQCSEPAALSADDELATISGEIVRAKGPHLECIFYHMDDLSRRKEPRALPMIARYLDVPNPRRAEDFSIGRSGPYGGEYPAIEYILWFRKSAVPVLVTTIEDEPSLSLKAKNAVLALMFVEASDPPSGVKLLAEVSRNQGEPKKAALLKAAQFAAESWQCHLIKTECQQALDLSIQSNVWEEEKQR